MRLSILGCLAGYFLVLCLMGIEEVLFMLKLFLTQNLYSFK